MSYGGKDLLEQSADILKKQSFELALHGAQTSCRDPESLRDWLALFRKRIGDSTRGACATTSSSSNLRTLGR